MKSVAKLSKFFDKAMRADAKHLLITFADGEYNVFGRFSIKIKGTDYIVDDIVIKQTVVFSTLKNALSWCTLTDCKKYKHSDRLSTLELKLLSLELDIAVHKKKLKSASNNDRSVYLTKLQEDTYRKRLVLAEIEDLINQSKRLQEDRFHKAKQQKFNYW
jgi:hypothetical protein